MRFFIALIDYGMGNLLSVSKALEYAGGKVRLVRTPAEAEGDFAPAAFAAFMAADAAEAAVTVGFVAIVRPSRNSPLTS